MKIITFLFLITHLSCNDSIIILIKNESNINFDSTLVKINNYDLKEKGVSAKDSVFFKCSKRLIHANHDVWFTFHFKKMDSLISANTFFSNDLGFVPDSFKLKITDSLKLERYL